MKNCRKCKDPAPIVEREIQKFIEKDTFNLKRNMDVAHEIERSSRCSGGNKLHSVKYECNNFRLQKNDKNEYNLIYQEYIYPPDSFCLEDHYNDKDMYASMCRQSRKDRYK